jgi:hypothetical protein
MAEIIETVAFVAAFWAGIMVASYFHGRKLSMAYEDGISVWVGDRFAYVVPARQYHHMQVCVHRCKIMDATRSTVHELDDAA